MTFNEISSVLICAVLITLLIETCSQPDAGRSPPLRLAVKNTAGPPMKTLTLTCPPRDTLV
jgi:hypothetical protein